MTKTIIFAITALITIFVLLGLFVFGYYIGLKNAVEVSEREIKTNDDPLFSSDKPRSWYLKPEDIDSIDNWEEFEERVDE